MKDKLRIFRAVHNLTQEELAEKPGVTRHTIIAIENERYDPSLRLARYPTRSEYRSDVPKIQTLPRPGIRLYENRRPLPPGHASRW